MERAEEGVIRSAEVRSDGVPMGQYQRPASRRSAQCRRSVRRRGAPHRSAKGGSNLGVLLPELAPRYGVLPASDIIASFLL